MSSKRGSHSTAVQSKHNAAHNAAHSTTHSKHIAVLYIPMPVKLKSIFNLLVQIKMKTKGEVLIYPVRAKDMTNKLVIKAFHRAGVKRLPVLISKHTGVAYEGCNSIKTVIGDIIRPPPQPQKSKRQFDDLDEAGLDYMDHVMAKRSMGVSQRMSGNPAQHAVQHKHAAQNKHTTQHSNGTRHAALDDNSDAESTMDYSIADSTAYTDDLDEYSD